MSILFEYDKTTELEDGFYVVRVTDNKGEVETTVAEFVTYGWNQNGIDFDVWQYSDVYTGCKIEVLARIDLEKLTITIVGE